MSRRTILFAILLVVFAVVYGGTDIRNRARTDLGPKYHRTDFTVYQAAARALSAGTNPYLAENPRGLRYVYPPLLALLILPLAGLPATTGALVFFAVSLAALVLLFLVLSRLATLRAAALALLVTIPYFHESFERGQVTIVLLAIQVVALVLLLRRREGIAGFLLALGGALRLTPLLPAAAVGVGCLFAIPRRGPRPFLRLAGGVTLGLAVSFVLLPVVLLGPSRALTVTREWIETSRAVYVAPPGKLEDLSDAYHVNEYRYKNQSVRRVLATYVGVASGAAFQREKPEISPAAFRRIDLAAYAVGGIVLLFALFLGARRLLDPDSPHYALAFSVTILLPVLVERYVWPTHLTAAFPALALVLGALSPRKHGRLPWAFLVFAAATVLFYAAHLPALEPVGAAGPLLFGVLALVAGATWSQNPRGFRLPWN